MTCIVGLVNEGRVYIGGDSAGVNPSLGLTIRTDKKVFRNGEFVMGFTSSFRMGQLLAFGFNPPKPRMGTELMAFMVTDFIDATRERLKAGGYVKVKEGVELGGNFLVGFHGRLFNVQADFQVQEAADGFDACGCGEPIALGSLYSTRDWRDPAARLTEALTAATRFSAGVHPPFFFETTNV